MALDLPSPYLESMKANIIDFSNGTYVKVDNAGNATYKTITGFGSSPDELRLYAFVATNDAQLIVADGQPTGGGASNFIPIEKGRLYNIACPPNTRPWFRANTSGANVTVGMLNMRLD